LEDCLEEQKEEQDKLPQQIDHHLNTLVIESDYHCSPFYYFSIDFGRKGITS
jgi:hypothetical protein